MMLKVLKEAGNDRDSGDQKHDAGEGVFVDFFGKPACTTTGMPRVALHTDAAVVPGTVLGPEFRNYRCGFEASGGFGADRGCERDVRENTQRVRR